MTEKLTDEERERIVNMYAADEPEAKALRIIDAHAAERAALVARVAELELELKTLAEESERRGYALMRSIDHWLEKCSQAEARVAELTREAEDDERDIATWQAACLRAEAQVAELTRERDEARTENKLALDDAIAMRLSAESEVTRLTEELAAEQHAARRSLASQRAAEARVRELEAADREAAKCIRELSDLRDAAEAQAQRDHQLAAEWKATAESYRVDAEVTRDRLTARAEAAEALLDEALTEKYQGSRKAWECVVRHQLARREASSGTARTEAEQRVLDAALAWFDDMTKTTELYDASHALKILRREALRG